MHYLVLEAMAQISMLPKFTLTEVDINSNRVSF